MLEKDVLEPERYEYLNGKDSMLYDAVKHSTDGLSQEVKRLLEEKAAACSDCYRRAEK